MFLLSSFPPVCSTDHIVDRVLTYSKLHYLAPHDIRTRIEICNKNVSLNKETEVNG